MQKNRAAARFAAGMDIVTEHDHKVVETIRAPEVFMGAPAWQAHLPVIGRRSRIVAPAIALPDPPHRQSPCGPRDSIGPKKARKKPKLSRRCRMIAFPLGMRNPGAPQRAGQHEGPGVEPPKRDLLRLRLARHACGHKTAQATLDLALPSRQRGFQFFCIPFHASLCFFLIKNDSPGSRCRTVLMHFTASRGRTSVDPETACYVGPQPRSFASSHSCK